MHFHHVAHGVNHSITTSQGSTEKQTKALCSHTHTHTQHDRPAYQTSLYKASPDSPAPLDVSLAAKAGFLLFSQK